MRSLSSGARAIHEGLITGSIVFLSPNRGFVLKYPDERLVNSEHLKNKGIVGVIDKAFGINAEGKNKDGYICIGSKWGGFV